MTAKTSFDGYDNSLQLNDFFTSDDLILPWRAKSCPGKERDWSIETPPFELSGLFSSDEISSA